MQSLSVFDMFKIGVGPSSSHTMGPWNATRMFAQQLVQGIDRDLQDRDLQHRDLQDGTITRLRVDLFGSLAKTGRGHATDVAVQMGLSGEDARTIDVDRISTEIAKILATKTISLGGQIDVPFDPAADIQFHYQRQLPAHPNGMTLTAEFENLPSFSETYYSIGGGFILREGEIINASEVSALPMPIENAADLLRHCQDRDCSIADVVRENELTWRSNEEMNCAVDEIIQAMIASVHRGCRSGGILPGGLGVRRRAAGIANRLLETECPETTERWIGLLSARQWDFSQTVDWVSCFALAVNEENAAMGRVVTAPTNGAAGVIPAVLMYLHCFCGGDKTLLRRFLMVASEIGCIFKKGATISAAMGGCQAEIGVSSAMAAAGLCEALGGTPQQAAMAAEIAMEHHLGLTCDPIGGLVQIPCIERNTMGAVKAITAARLSLQSDPVGARVSLDNVVATMWATAQDMSQKYKETSEGGLAVLIPVNISEC